MLCQMKGVEQRERHKKKEVAGSASHSHSSHHTQQVT
jgi:hypothetical protein